MLRWIANLARTHPSAGFFTVPTRRRARSPAGQKVPKRARLSEVGPLSRYNRPRLKNPAEGGVLRWMARSNLKLFGHLNRFGQTNLGWRARLMRAWKARMSAHGRYSARHSRDMRAYARKHLIGPFTSGLLVPKLVRC